MIKNCTLQFVYTNNTLSGSQKVSSCSEEISSVLDKRAISVVPPALSQSGFYSRCFLVPKWGGRGGGGWGGVTSICPNLDLRALNKHLRQYQFKILTNASLLRLVRQNNWFTLIDLKDTYCIFMFLSILPTGSTSCLPSRKFATSTVCSISAFP